MTGPIVVGFVAGSVGFGPAFVLTGAVAAVAFVAWLFARETAPEVVGEAPRLHPTDQAEPDSP